MDPVTIAILAGTAVNIGASIWGQSEQNDAAERQRDFEAMKLRMNQQISQIMITDLWKRTNQDARDYKKAIKTEIGAQRANFAAQGVAVDSGSAFEVQAETAYQAEVDLLRMRNNAYREAFGYKVNALTDAISTQNLINASKNQQTNNNISTGINVFRSTLGALPAFAKAAPNSASASFSSPYGNIKSTATVTGGG